MSGAQKLKINERSSSSKKQNWFHRITWLTWNDLDVD